MLAAQVRDRLNSQRAHLPFIALLVAGTVVRAVATAGYPSVLWFGDSNGYLSRALEPAPSTLRPGGYSFFLQALAPLHSLKVVAGVQHLLGISVGVLVYALVWRAAARAWPAQPMRAGLLGTAAAAPCLLDAYQVELEHLLMSDALFIALVVAAVALVSWWERPGWWLGLPLGALLAAATLTRTVGLAVAVVILAWLLVRRAGARLIVVTATVVALGLAGYASWFHVVHDRFAITASNGVFLYGRVAAFADCDVIKPQPHLAALCPEQARTRPDFAPGFVALWTEQSPFKHIQGGVGGANADRLAGAFARQAIMAQPLEYLRVAAHDTLRTFSWRRVAYPTPGTPGRYRFPPEMELPPEAAGNASAYTRGRLRTEVVEPYAALIRGYQRWVIWPGALLGVVLAAGAAGMVVRRRPWGGPAALPWLAATALLVAPPLLADFDYRYVLPAVPLAMLAAALAVLPASSGQRT